jgi:ketosteroid isomerase-like protein
VSDHHFQRKEKQMTETNHKALAIAQTYVNAIAKKNVDAMIAVSADGVVCTPPLGRITGTQKFREFHDGFARMIKKVTVLAVYPLPSAPPTSSVSTNLDHARGTSAGGSRKNSMAFGTLPLWTNTTRVNDG